MKTTQGICQVVGGNGVLYVTPFQLPAVQREFAVGPTEVAAVVFTARVTSVNREEVVIVRTNLLLVVLFKFLGVPHLLPHRM